MAKNRKIKLKIKEPKQRNFLIPHLMTRNGGGKHRDRKRESKQNYQD